MTSHIWKKRLWRKLTVAGAMSERKSNIWRMDQRLNNQSLNTNKFWAKCLFWYNVPTQISHRYADLRLNQFFRQIINIDLNISHKLTWYWKQIWVTTLRSHFRGGKETAVIWSFSIVVVLLHPGRKSTVFVKYQPHFKGGISQTYCWSSTK